MGENNEKDVNLVRRKQARLMHNGCRFCGRRSTSATTILHAVTITVEVNMGPYLFAVVGNSPLSIYSFIRIQHPDRVQFEYRLRPFNSAIFVEQSDR